MDIFDYKDFRITYYRVDYEYTRTRFIPTSIRIRDGRWNMIAAMKNDTFIYLLLTR